MNNLIQIAKKYRAAGFSIIPLVGKRPPIDWKVYQERHATDEELIDWFSRYESMGIVTGRISGITVIDIDAKSGGLDTLKTLGLPLTWTVRTGGGGWHYYYAYDERISQTAGVYQGIDVRNDGGYVVAPPSPHESGKKYEWTYKEDELVNCPVELFEIKKGKKDWSTFLTLGTYEGSRNNNAASLFGKLMTLFSAKEWDSIVWQIGQSWNDKNTPPLPELELRHVFDSIKKRAANNPKTIEELLDTNASLPTIIDRLKTKSKLPKTFYSWGGTLTSMPLLQPHTYMVLFGQFSSGKTTFAMYLARENQINAKVCLLSLEMNKDKVIEQYILKRAGITSDIYKAGFYSADIFDTYSEEIKHIDIIGISEESHKTSYTIDDVEKIIEKNSPDILIIDNFNKLKTGSPGIDSDNELSSQLLFLTRKYPVCLILIHHANKPKGTEKEVLRGIHGLRGTNKLNDDADIVCELGRPNPDDEGYIPGETHLGIYKDREWDHRGNHKLLFSNGTYIYC